MTEKALRSKKLPMPQASQLRVKLRTAHVSNAKHEVMTIIQVERLLRACNKGRHDSYMDSASIVGGILDFSVQLIMKDNALSLACHEWPLIACSELGPLDRNCFFLVKISEYSNTQRV